MIPDLVDTRPRDQDGEALQEFEWEALQAIEGRLAALEPAPATRSEPVPPAVVALRKLGGIGDAGAGRWGWRS